MGLWYTNPCLFPQTLGTEVARINDVKRFDDTGPTGRSLREASDHAIPWLESHPGSSFTRAIRRT
jgi:hypothetical protein